MKHILQVQNSSLLACHIKKTIGDWRFKNEKNTGGKSQHFFPANRHRHPRPWVAEIGLDDGCPGVGSSKLVPDLRAKYWRAAE